MATGIPAFGNLILCAVLACAGYTFAIAVLAGRGRSELLPAARYGTYATCAFVAVGVFGLAYAFQVHDFRIRYVAHYSDRSMPWWYLWTALWGGQDGSLLWWSFILSLYTVVCTRSLRDRLSELQPYILATLMSILMFFLVLMLFAANPFATQLAGVPPDGEGLNPLLQNYWMTIHPPTLYTGMVGWSVPFAFAIAALATGRLGNEWIGAVRRWAVFAWVVLAAGNLLGMMWSYEELGWGGYWAWDPVENASFMPLLTGTAYIHSVMLQERRGMFKVWNVFLLCLTFFLTIFGTFLTRSGLIASVHSFARSDLGGYFLVYMGGLVALCAVLIVWRLPQLKAENRIDALLSRDFSFLLNNWILMGMAFFILIATTWPLLSEWLRDETVTVGPGYYNKWMVPLGLVLLFLTGFGPLMAWRKATGSYLLRVLVLPCAALLVTCLLHVVVGPSLGYPAYVESDEIYDTATGRALAAVYAVAPVVSSSLCAFVFAAIAQEFWRGAAVRVKRRGESPWVALFRLTFKAKRRYGGYIVHLGVALMFFGFTGAAYDTEKEAALRPGQSVQVGGYDVRYDGSRMEADPNKRMVFSDMTLLEQGRTVDRVAPAKFIYTKARGQATTEVAIRSTPKHDLYLIMNTVRPDSGLGTFLIKVRPFVMWIWLGGLVMFIGTFISLSPSVRELLGEAARPALARPRARSVATATLLVALCIAAFVGLWAPLAAQGQAQGSSSLHAGSVAIKNPTERRLFPRLLCQCGECQRLPLSTCACSWADDMRAEVRQKLAAGMEPAQIEREYRAQFGAEALAIPADEGLDRALWAVPVAALALAAGGLFWLARRWARRGAGELGEPRASVSGHAMDAYDRALDEELRRLDRESPR
ncbi:MAG: cytochrome c biogenesis protein CcsA [Proteobacteria bacterium]|nr:cytochrome c biogenesis protein CcsA [Pseudomonadota bacterium]